MLIQMDELSNVHLKTDWSNSRKFVCSSTEDSENTELFRLVNGLENAALPEVWSLQRQFPQDRATAMHVFVAGCA